MVVIQTFENVWMGVTGSQWIMVIEFLAIMALSLVILTLIYYAGPTFGYIKARYDKKVNVAIVFQNHDITIKSLDYFAGIFHNKLGLTWLQKKFENHNFGTCNCELVADFWGITMNAKDNIAAKVFIDKWNDNDCSDYNYIEDREQITDPESLYKALNLLKDDDEIKIRAFCYIPIYELKNYLHQNQSAASMTGYLEAMKKVNDDKQNGPQSNLMLLLVVGGLALGFVVGKFV